jgi:formyl-CoA transferase
MIADPRFADNGARVRHAEACEAPIAAFIAARDRDEVMAIFAREGITAAPVHDIAGLMADPHVAAREVLVDLPDDTMGHVLMHNVVARLSATPGALRHPAPGLGQHTAEVLAALGLEAAALRELGDRGVIRLG